MNKPHRVLVVLVLAIFCHVAASSAEAAVMLLGSVDGSSLDASISRRGTLVDAYNLGTTTNVTRNTVPFAGDVGTDGIAGSATLATTGGGSLASADIGSGIDSLFYTETYSAGGTGMTLTYAGLNPSRRYLVQVFHGENRSCCQGTFSAVTFSDAGGTVNVPAFTLGNSIANENPPAPADRRVITAQVTGVSQLTYTMPNGAGRGASIDGYQVRDITGLPVPMVDLVSVQNGSAPPALDNTFGTLDLALNFGNGGALTRDGIAFQNNNVTSGTNAITYGTFNGITVSATSSGGVWNNANLGSGTDALFLTESYPTGNSPFTLTLTGLDPLRSYEIQILHGESRALTYNNGTITVATDGLAGDITDTAQLTFGPGGTGNAYAVVTAQVFGSSWFSYSMPAAGRGPSIDGIVVLSQVSTVPEPSAIVLLLSGAIGLAGFLRRRR